MATLEDTRESIQRLRFLQQVELAETPLTAEQSATVDTICGVLPLVDSPTLLQLVPEATRPAVRRLIATLPRTRVIERIDEGHWPQ